MYSFLSNLIVLLILFAIIASLGYGLFFLLFNQGNGTQTYKALVIRICLSMMLFLGLIVAIFFGWITPGPPPL